MDIELCEDTLSAFAHKSAKIKIKTRTVETVQVISIDSHEPTTKEEPIKVESDIKYGCIMVPIKDPVLAKEIKSFTDLMINSADLAEDGIEDEPHVTLFYGLHTNISLSEVKNFVVNHIHKFSFKLGEVDKFRNDVDVLKININDENLTHANALIQKYFKTRSTVKFPVYKAHLTLAYLKTGANDNLVGNKTFKDRIVNVEEILYSTPQATNKTIIKLSK